MWQTLSGWGMRRRRRGAASATMTTTTMMPMAMGGEDVEGAIGRWAYQAKKEEEEQINLVLFVTKN
jgi:hypothetical protein